MSLDQIRAVQEEMRKVRERDKRQQEAEIKAQHEKLGLESSPKEKDFHGDGDHPSTMENGTATILYALVMLIGTIFQDRWLIYMMASFIYFRFIGRHKKK